MLRSTEVFDRVCKALFGETYDAVAAKELHVRRDTVRHWSTGRRGVPPEIWLKLHNIASAQALRVTTAIHEIEETLIAEGHMTVNHG